MGEYSFLSSNGKTKIYCVSWEPVKKPKAVLLIVHGMCEFIMRYSDFASTLAKDGILVAGHDLLGHGKSVNSKEEWGYFGKNGNKNLIEDIEKHREILEKENPGVPIFILGHSMGSFLTRQYISRFHDKLNGAIIMGTGQMSIFTTGFAKLILNLISVFRKRKFRSKMIQQLAFGSYLKRIKNPKTIVDWLTKDENIIRIFCENEANTFIFTLDGFYNMMVSIEDCCKKSVAKLVKKDLPLFFVSGTEDPVGNYGKGVEKAANLYKSAGVRDVKLKLYKGDRHEILNELDRVVVYGDIMNWIDSKL